MVTELEPLLESMVSGEYPLWRRPGTALAVADGGTAADAGQRLGQDAVS